MTTRRHFLQTSAAGTLAASAAAAQDRKISANDKIRFAAIGVGGMGSGDVRSALSVEGTELVAVADCYQGRLERAREAWGKTIDITRDYREILERKDVDAVIVATPDHWQFRHRSCKSMGNAPGGWRCCPARTRASRLARRSIGRLGGRKLRSHQANAQPEGGMQRRPRL